MAPSEPSKRSAFWTAFKAVGRAFSEGISPLPALKELLSQLQSLLTIVVVLVLVLLVCFLVCGRRNPIPPVEESPGPTTSSAPPKQPDAEKNLDNESHASSVTGHDQQNRTAVFDVVVWDQRFNWHLGDNATVELGGHAVEFPEHLAKPAIQARMSGARALIAVGSASQEIQTLELEERRSDERANRLATWLEESINKPTYTLSLGRYQASRTEMANSPVTTRQRPIAIVGIKDCQDGVILAEALADALYAKDKRFPFDSRKYARFDLQPQKLTCLKAQIRDSPP